MKYLYISLILLSILLPQSTSNDPLPYRKAGPVKLPYAYKTKNFEVVIPKRVNSKSQHLTHSMIHHHQDQSNPEDTLYLSVPIEGQPHHIELRPARNILSPRMIIESFHHVRRSELMKPDPRKNRRCHYRGKIRGHRRSRAALSTCNGLSGYIQTGNGLFMIEPRYIRDFSMDLPHPHIVYPLSTEANNLFCSMPPPPLPVRDETEKRKRLLPEEVLSPNGTAVSGELTVELLVVLDKSLLQYHKDVDIENYVMTIINIAHDIFHESTLGVNINLAIVRLIRLEVEDHEMNIATTHNIEKALNFFRIWQKKINPKEDTHPNHHDMAILLTRNDICSDVKTCGFLGAARYAGMCDPENEAIIAQDNGLHVGYTIAHEIGHTLNMPHDIKPLSLSIDASGKPEDDSKTIMSPYIMSNWIEWSNCSRMRLKDFIDYGFGSCLFDAPTEHSFVLPDTLPGVMYDGDYQCKEMFGPNAALCMTGLECDNLICYVEDKGCIESHTMPAEGTSCGENKWCFHGECVEVGERPQTVHGEWGNWSEWSECSRTCGSGVSSQSRQCDHPAPKNGGKYCSGDNIRYKICSTDPCDLDQPSFRDIQCSEFNSWVYPGDGEIHQWKNYPIHDENPCALYCVSETGNVASLRPRVIDGTTCYRGIRDICINGLCKEIPCDLDLQSAAVEDRCGVCKGDGMSCEVIRGERSMVCDSMVEGEKQIMTIPAGAVNIKIEEMLPSETRIEVRDGNGTTTFIDGDVLGMHNMRGSRAWVGMIRTKQEAISIQGPVNENISIWANVQENSTLKYTYGMPTKKKRSPVFSWDYLDWSTCSTECGPGVQASVAKCVEKASGLVDESYCKDIPHLKNQLRPCEIAPCNARWFVGDWGPCLHCPFGVRTRVVKCYRPVGIGEGELDFIADSNCANNKPKVSEGCSCKHEKPRCKRRQPRVATYLNPKSTTIVKSTRSPIRLLDSTSVKHLTSTTDNRLSSTTSMNKEIHKTGEDSEYVDEDSANGYTIFTVTPKENDLVGVSETSYEVFHNRVSRRDVVSSSVSTSTYPSTVDLSSCTADAVTGPRVKSVFDFVKFKKVRLTVHTELENDKYPPGLPHPKKLKESSYELQGREALKFLNTLQHDFSNNKTKI